MTRTAFTRTAIGFGQMTRTAFGADYRSGPGPQPRRTRTAFTRTALGFAKMTRTAGPRDFVGPRTACNTEAKSTMLCAANSLQPIVGNPATMSRRATFLQAL